jgi:hypothetical protein
MSSISTSKEDWKSFVSALKDNKDDFKVDFFLSESLTGPELTQEDRDHVYRAAVYFATKSKRVNCPAVHAIPPLLDMDCQGYRQNKTAESPIHLIFMSAKHFGNMCFYFSSMRASLHNVIVHVQIDGSGFFPVM